MKKVKTDIKYSGSKDTVFIMWKQEKNECIAPTLDRQSQNFAKLGIALKVSVCYSNNWFMPNWKSFPRGKQWEVVC